MSITIWIACRKFRFSGVLTISPVGRKQSARLPVSFHFFLVAIVCLATHVPVRVGDLCCSFNDRKETIIIRAHHSPHSSASFSDHIRLNRSKNAIAIIRLSPQVILDRMDNNRPDYSRSPFSLSILTMLAAILSRCVISPSNTYLPSESLLSAMPMTARR